LVALLILPAPVFLILVAMLQPLAVALRSQAIAPLIAMALLILIFVTPQLALIFGRRGGSRPTKTWPVDKELGSVTDRPERL
jgi:hypothetical protein